MGADHRDRHAVAVGRDRRSGRAGRRRAGAGIRNGRVVRVTRVFGDDALARVLDVAERGER
jgi:hypothetical protein